MAHEINLVPDIKGEMIKALKLRNLIFFICIVVAAASIGMILIVGSIVGGQSLALEGKKDVLASMSNKVNSYNDLSDFLTIQNQVNKISTITDEKVLSSRIFNFISKRFTNLSNTKWYFLSCSSLNILKVYENTLSRFRS